MAFRGVFGPGAPAARRWVGLTIVALLGAWLTVGGPASGYNGNGEASCDGRPATMMGSGPINGTSGNDVIVGSSGPDTINAGGGHDVVCGGLGDDTINGGSGNDRLFGFFGSHYYGIVDPFNDADTIHGDSGNDFIDGGPDFDFLFGDSGNDALDGDGDGAECDGGSGVDTEINCDGGNNGGPG
jgi:Ca2+-binding RTX toxin-like protein